MEDETGRVIGLDDLQGHWRRAWLRLPGGVEDATTRVHWIQSGALFADIRIPLDRPATGGAQSLSDLGPRALSRLMAAEGFAGHITVEDGICTWHREVNWHGTPEGVDAGRMSFDAEGALIEDGVHAEYAELWRQVPGPAFDARSIAAGELCGVLVWSGALFLMGLGAPDLPATAPLRAALAEGETPEGLARVFDGDYILGRWEGREGIATLATNPLREGRKVLEWRGVDLIWHWQRFDGETGRTRLDFTDPSV